MCCWSPSATNDVFPGRVNEVGEANLNAFGTPRRQDATCHASLELSPIPQKRHKYAIRAQYLMIPQARLSTTCIACERPGRPQVAGKPPEAMNLPSLRGDLSRLLAYLHAGGRP
ncbi:MAG: hypothetical protein KDH88_10070 [Chromatiales bacterium]|nr:hypothetical protein [Chromatiales bacterium]